MSYVQTESPQSGSGRGSGPRSGFWRRFGALIVDSILLGIINGILVALLHGAGYAIGFVIGTVYYTLLEGGARGQTLGKSALGIRVISFENGGPIGYGRGFIRFLGRYVSGIIIGIGYLWMLWDRESQCWHDKFAGDVVVPVSAYPLSNR